MHRPDTCLLAAESAADLHQARIIERRAHLGPSIQNAPCLVGEHGGGNISVFHRKCSAEATALIGFVEIDIGEAPDFSQQTRGLVTYVK